MEYYAGLDVSLRSCALCIVDTKGDPNPETIFSTLIKVLETVCLEVTSIDAKVQRRAKEDPLARRLTSIPGVGPIVSLSFIATIDDVARFRKATDVGA